MLSSKARRSSAAAIAAVGPSGFHRARVVDQDVHAGRFEPGRGAPAQHHRLGLGQLVRGAGEQDQAGTGVRQPERDGTADAAPAPVISAVLPVKSDVMTVSFICHRTGTRGSSQPPFGKEKKISDRTGKLAVGAADRVMACRIEDMD
jgi:hypothetical protein